MPKKHLDEQSLATHIATTIYGIPKDVAETYLQKDKKKEIQNKTQKQQQKPKQSSGNRPIKRKLNYGTKRQYMDRFYEDYPEVIKVTDSIANAYGINPNAYRNRLEEEGFFDYLVRENDDNYASNKPARSVYGKMYSHGDNTGFTLFGLDDVGTMIDKGLVKPINERWYGANNRNEQGRDIYSAEGESNLDNMGLVAATLKYFRDVAKKDNPNSSDYDLDRSALAYYHRGLAGGRKWFKNGAEGYNFPNKRRTLANGGTIYIKPSHRGRFNALRERTGHSATWFKENGTPAQKKMATFALNASKWNHKG